jgi:polyisoprenoid-binding protein YceI
MRTLILTAALTLATLPAFAATQWKVDPAASNLSWTVPFNKQPVTGKFDKWDGQIAFDPADLATSSIVINVDLTSVNSKDANRDGTLKGADFFNTAATPKATYTSSKITKTAQGYVAAGTLSLAGVSKPVALPFTVTITGDKAVANGKLMLSRSAFGVGKGQWKSASEIADLVEVTFTVSANVAK